MQKLVQSTKMFYILTAIAAVSSLYFIVPGVTIAEETPKTFLTHTGLVIQTTGEVIDPIGYDGDALDFDPEKFMKDFDYGCLLYTSPSPRDLSTSRIPSSA